MQDPEATDRIGELADAFRVAFDAGNEDAAFALVVSLPQEDRDAVEALLHSRAASLQAAAKAYHEQQRRAAEDA